MNNPLIVIVNIDGELEILVKAIQRVPLNDFNTVISDTLIALECPFTRLYDANVHLLLWGLETKIKDLLQCEDFAINAHTNVRLRSDRQFIVEVQPNAF